MKKKNQITPSQLRPVATMIIKDALDQYMITLAAAECTATAIWFLALAHGMAAEIYDGIDSPVSIKRYGKKGKGLNVMLWSDLDTVLYVDIFTKNAHSVIETVYCLDNTEKSITQVDSDIELIEWLKSKFSRELM